MGSEIHYFCDKCKREQLQQLPSFTLYKDAHQPYVAHQMMTVSKDLCSDCFRLLAKMLHEWGFQVYGWKDEKAEEILKRVPKLEVVDPEK